MGDESRRREAARQLILDVLNGTVTPESRPDVFEDDLLYFAARSAEESDLDWLRSTLLARRWPREHAGRVLECASPGAWPLLDVRLSYGWPVLDRESGGRVRPAEPDAALTLRDPDGRWFFALLSAPGMWGLIGNAPPADLLLPTPTVSTRHARVFFARGTWFVEDVGSASGTWLDGRSIREAEPLFGGERLRIGVVTLDTGLSGSRPP